VTNSETLASHRTAFQTALRAWYRANARRLPWREAPTLYPTVVSEFMLQQTQVATVLPYFDRWMRALPDFAALASAPEAQVLKLWEGLGYYSRARNLHALAKALAVRPAPPRTPAEWRELPGVGPYTAAAITSISFGESAACVDGNVVRILARLTGEGRRFRDGSAAAKFFAPLADSLVVGSDPGEHNQAMMELGATVCVRANPHCGICPIANFCIARRRGKPDQFPRLRPKLVERRTVARVWCIHRGRLLLCRGHANAKRLAGLYELPEAADVGLLPDADSLLAIRRRAITRFRIEEEIYRIVPTAALLGHIAESPALEWISLARFDSIAFSGPHRRWIGEMVKKEHPK